VLFVRRNLTDFGKLPGEPNVAAEAKSFRGRGRLAKTVYVEASKQLFCFYQGLGCFADKLLSLPSISQTPQSVELEGQVAVMITE